VYFFKVVAAFSRFGRGVAGRSLRQRQRVTIWSDCPANADSTARHCAPNCAYFVVISYRALRTRKALEASQQDARRPGQSFAEVALAIPIHSSAGVVDVI
jgi:hypothetical protein